MDTYTTHYFHFVWIVVVLDLSAPVAAVPPCLLSTYSSLSLEPLRLPVPSRPLPADPERAR